jgi:hypothetical protein
VAAVAAMTRRILFFAVGFLLGGMLYAVAAVGSEPAPPKCPGCAVLSPAIHDPACNVAVQGGWVCEGR